MTRQMLALFIDGYKTPLKDRTIGMILDQKLADLLLLIAFPYYPRRSLTVAPSGSLLQGLKGTTSLTLRVTGLKHSQHVVHTRQYETSEI